MGYFVFVFFVLLFAFLGDEKVTGIKKANIFRCLLVFTLAYMIGLGGALATDHADYRDVYNQLTKFSNIDIDNVLTFFFGRYEDEEYGFVILSLLIKKLGFSSVGFFFLIALITNTFIVNTFYRFKNPLLIFVIFLSSPFLAQEPNLVRQTLAVSMFAYSLRYVVEKDWRKYLVFVFLMFLMHHSSAVSILFLPFCFNLKVDVHKTIKTLLLVVWVASILVAIGKFALNLDRLALMMSLTEGYDLYLSDENVIGTQKITFDIVYNLLVVTYFFFGKNKKEENVYAYCFMLGAVIQNISIPFVNFYRVSLYFSIIGPAFISQLIYDMRQDKKRKALMTGFAALLILNYFRLLLISINNNSEYIGKEMASIFDIF